MIDKTRRGLLAAGTAGAAATLFAAGPASAAGARRGSAEFVLPPAATVSLAVAGTGGRFPVRRIYCVGRNYLAHVRELDNNEAEPPFFFQKQRDMIVETGGRVRYPALTQDFQFETELVVALKGGGTDIAAERVQDHVFGYAVGLDMTRRDRQSDMKAMQKPWEIGKSFEDSAPCGPITPIAKTGFLAKGRIALRVNDKIRQDSDLDHMIWDVRAIVAELSKQVELAAGDLIYTGTPEGVGPVQRGDRLVARVDGLQPLEVVIV